MGSANHRKNANIRDDILSWIDLTESCEFLDKYFDTDDFIPFKASSLQPNFIESATTTLCAKMRKFGVGIIIYYIIIYYTMLHYVLLYYNDHVF